MKFNKKNFLKKIMMLGFLGCATTSLFTACSSDSSSSTSSNTITVNNVSFTMVYVTGGTFSMGAQSTNSSGTNYDSLAVSNESPVHSVTVGNYYIGTSEVTQQLWLAVMGYTPTESGNQWKSIYGEGTTYPAYYITYNEALNFIAKLNALTGKTFRLPTEAEWEYAARGGNKSGSYIYSGSNTITTVAWYTKNSTASHAVDTKTANELGLYDMSGNVWEWCSDYYGSYGDASANNPTGPATGTNHVLRGGSYSSAGTTCRVAYRTSDTPTSSVNNYGLRLVLVP